MKMLRLPQVIAATGLSRMTVYRLLARNEFPQQRQLGRPGGHLNFPHPWPGQHPPPVRGGTDR